MRAVMRLVVSLVMVGVAAGANMAASLAQSPVVTGAQSPIERYNLSGWYQIKSIAKPGFGLNNLATGFPELEKTKPDWESAYWQFEAVPGTPYVLIKNKWKATYLQDDNGSLRVAATVPANEAAHWLLEGSDTGPYGRVRNRRDGRYLISTSGGFDLVAQFDASASSYWQFHPRTTASKMGFTAPVAAATAVAAAVVAKTTTKPALPSAPPTCAVHHIYSAKQKSCIHLATTCGRTEVYSSSVRSCIPDSDNLKGNNPCKKGFYVGKKTGKCISDDSEDTTKPVKSGCEEGFKLVNGTCQKVPKSKPQSCPSGTKAVSQTDNCVWKKDKNGFEIDPWKKPGCSAFKAACAKGNKSACSKYEAICQVN